LFKDHEGTGVRRKEKNISALTLLRKFVILHDALYLLCHDKTEGVYLILDVVSFLCFVVNCQAGVVDFILKTIYFTVIKKVSSNEHASTIQ